MWRENKALSFMITGFCTSVPIYQNIRYHIPEVSEVGRLHLKCDGIRAETRFRLSAKRTSPFKPAGASVQSTTGSRVVLISGTNAGYTTFRGSVKGTGYPLHSLVSPSLPLPCVTVCHHISTGLYPPLWQLQIGYNNVSFNTMALQLDLVDWLLGASGPAVRWYTGPQDWRVHTDFQVAFPFLLSTFSSPALHSVSNSNE
jgi:hypothetical protein